MNLLASFYQSFVIDFNGRVQIIIVLYINFKEAACAWLNEMSAVQ